MELNVHTIALSIYPTAAFADHFPPHSGRNSNDTPPPWEKSQLNPQNRIDSLETYPSPKWRIDGCTSLGTQFYTIPTFLKTLPPMRIDTFIPELSTLSFELRSLLQSNTAFYLKDSRVSRLPISRYILRALELWTQNIPDFERFYKSLPFGSRILFENLPIDLKELRIKVVQMHSLERRLLSIETLKSMWNLPSSSFPLRIDISQVQVLRQLHDSVCLVHAPGPSGENEIAILKALTSFPRYLYHELKVLLTMASHPRIIGKPLHLVTKKCGFGSKRAVIGFTIPYLPNGSLHNVIPSLMSEGKLTLSMQLKWSIQLTEALLHVREKSKRFYSDIRLENLVLDENDDLVMVDFEQRGVLTHCPAPEISYLDAILQLANSEGISVEMSKKYQSLSNKYMGESTPILSESYHDSEQGYCAPWICLTPEEQEAAEVLMLGRALWCIFEGQACPEESIWMEYQYASDLEFPDFKRTPGALRELILACARGGKEWDEKFPVVRVWNRLVLRRERKVDLESTAEQVQEEAKRWWVTELEKAEEFLERREKADSSKGTNWFERPKLREVLSALKRYDEGFRRTE